MKNCGMIDKLAYVFAVLVLVAIAAVAGYVAYSTGANDRHIIERASPR